MIYVNQKQLEQVEYLIEQSTKGFHVLFDNDVIREVFRKFDELPQPGSAGENGGKDGAKGDSEQIEKHIENLILQPTLVSKRAYLENLSPDVYVRVVRTYFSIVENNIFESLKFSQ